MWTKVTVDTFVPPEGEFLDGGWFMTTIYINENLSDDHAVKAAIGRYLYTTEVTRYRNLRYESASPITHTHPADVLYKTIIDRNGNYIDPSE